MLHLFREFKENREIRLGNTGRQARVLWSKSQFCPQQSSFLQFFGAARQSLWVGLGTQAIPVQYAEAGPQPIDSHNPCVTLVSWLGSTMGTCPKSISILACTQSPEKQGHPLALSLPQSPWCLGKVSLYPIIYGLSLPWRPSGAQGLRHGGFNTSEPCSLGAKHPRTFAVRRTLILAQKASNAFPVSGKRERMHGRNP